MPKSVSVVDVLERSTANVHEKALAAFARDLAAYRAGCKAMAEHGGELPESEAAELLAVCGRLGIDPERLSADYSAFVRLRNLEARVAEIEARNVAQRKPLPALAADLEKTQTAFVRIRTECMGRIQAAEAELRAARHAHEAVANLPDERTDRERDEITAVRTRFPHLFRADMQPDELRNFLARS